MHRIAKIVSLLSFFALALGLGGWTAAFAGDGARSLTLTQMVFLHGIPYATSYSIQVEPGYSSGGATVYEFSGSAYLAGDLNKLTEMGFDLGRVAGRLVFGGLVPAQVLTHVPALALVGGELMSEGRYDFGSFGTSYQHLMIDPAKNQVHGHIYVKTVAPALNTVGDRTAPVSITATFAHDKITGLVSHGTQLTGDLKYDQKRHDPTDPMLEGTVYTRLYVTVLSQTEWTFAGEVVSTLRADP